MICVIIYLIGCVIACFIDIKHILGYRDYELGDLLSSTLLITILSWLTVFAYIIAYIEDSIDSNTVLFKHKKK